MLRKGVKDASFYVDFLWKSLLPNVSCEVGNSLSLCHFGVATQKSIKLVGHHFALDPNPFPWFSSFLLWRLKDNRAIRRARCNPSYKFPRTLQHLDDLGRAQWRHPFDNPFREIIPLILRERLEIVGGRLGRRTQDSLGRTRRHHFLATASSTTLSAGGLTILASLLPQTARASRFSSSMSSTL